MTLALRYYDVFPAGESPARTPQEENLLAIWNQIDSMRKRYWRESLISLSESGLDGEEDQDELYGIDVDDEGRIMIEIDIKGNILVDLDALMDPGEERTKLGDTLIQLLKERFATNIN